MTTGLAVSRPDDVYEQEAGRVADQVMRRPQSSAPNLPPVSQKANDSYVMRACAPCEEEIKRRQSHGKACPRCEEGLPREERQRLKEERTRIRRQQEERRREALRRRSEEGVQRKEMPDSGPLTVPADRRINDVIGRDGSPLPASVRSPMEESIGYDFSGVRVHTDATAAEAAHLLSARAFTVGRNIVFGPGQYAPETGEGRRLLAHELTHTVQQQGSRREAVKRAGTDLRENGRDNQKDLQPAESAPAKSVDVARQSLQPVTVQRVSFFETLARFFGGGTFSDEELQTYLKLLKDTHAIEDNYDSDNKAREIVKRWSRGDSKYSILSLEIRILLIKEMLSGFTGDDDEQAILQILHGSSESEVPPMQSSIGVEVLRDNFQGAEREELDDFLAGKGVRRRPEAARPGHEAGDADEESFPEERVQEARDRFMENALLGDARSHCIGIIHEVLPRLLSGDPGLEARVERTLRGLRSEGETYTIDATGEALRKLRLASNAVKIYFSGNSDNEKAEPGDMTSSAWSAILDMAGSEVGWHIFGMSLFNGYHSVAVFVNNRPDGKKHVYWADQWAIGPGDNFLQEEGSASGFRRYEKPGFDGFINKLTHDWWCQKSTCDGAHWRATLTVWKFYTHTAGR